jgi:hypothetical protein
MVTIALWTIQQTWPLSMQERTQNPNPNLSLYLNQSLNRPRLNHRRMQATQWT